MREVSPGIKFGTDGWRGVISDDFTFANVRLVAQAIADYYNNQARKSGRKNVAIAVGFDTRFLSDRYAQLISEVLAQNGIDVILSDRPVPTPTLSFAVRKRKLSAGVMITASHNPGQYNGIKIKTAEGGAAGVEVTGEVEKLIGRRGKRIKNKTGRVKKADLTQDYIKFLRGYVQLARFKNAGFRILVDAMHGSGGSLLREVLKGTGIKLAFHRQELNPLFDGLHPEPIPVNLGSTFARMKKEKFDLCLVLDGDADRIACITGDGEFVNPQKILGLLILHLIQDRKLNGGVVKTLVGTNIVNKIARDLRLKVYETPVGFKYISELMVKENILVGGEEAGGIGFKNYIPERDGSLAGLLLVEMMVYRKKSLQGLLKEMESVYGRYYYLREALKLTALGGFKLDSLKKINKISDLKVSRIDDSDGLKFILSDESWLMLRTSGTEPIIRIYAESKSLAKTKKLLEFGKRMISKNAL